MKNCLNQPSRFSRWHLPAPRSSQVNCRGRSGFGGTQPLHHGHISIPCSLDNPPAMVSSQWSHLAFKNFTLGHHSPAKEDVRQGYVCLGAAMQPNLPCSKPNPASFTCFGVLEQKFNTSLISLRFLTVVSSYNVSKRANSH